MSHGPSSKAHANNMDKLKDLYLRDFLTLISSVDRDMKTFPMKDLINEGKINTDDTSRVERIFGPSDTIKKARAILLERIRLPNANTIDFNLWYSTLSPSAQARVAKTILDAATNDWKCSICLDKPTTDNIQFADPCAHAACGTCWDHMRICPYCRGNADIKVTGKSSGNTVGNTPGSTSTHNVKIICIKDLRKFIRERVQILMNIRGKGTSLVVSEIQLIANTFPNILRTLFYTSTIHSRDIKVVVVANLLRVFCLDDTKKPSPSYRKKRKKLLKHCAKNVKTPRMLQSMLSVLNGWGLNHTGDWDYYPRFLLTWIANLINGWDPKQVLPEFIRDQRAWKIFFNYTRLFSKSTHRVEQKAFDTKTKNGPRYDRLFNLQMMICVVMGDATRLKKFLDAGYTVVYAIGSKQVQLLRVKDGDVKFTSVDTLYDTLVANGNNMALSMVKPGQLFRGLLRLLSTFPNYGDWDRVFGLFAKFKTKQLLELQLTLRRATTNDDKKSKLVLTRTGFIKTIPNKPKNIPTHLMTRVMGSINRVLDTRFLLDTCFQSDRKKPLVIDTDGWYSAKCPQGDAPVFPSWVPMNCRKVRGDSIKIDPQEKLVFFYKWGFGNIDSIICGWVLDEDFNTLGPSYKIDWKVDNRTSESRQIGCIFTGDVTTAPRPNGACEAIIGSINDIRNHCGPRAKYFVAVAAVWTAGLKFKDLGISLMGVGSQGNLPKNGPEGSTLLGITPLNGDARVNVGIVLDLKSNVLMFVDQSVMGIPNGTANTLMPIMKPHIMNGVDWCSNYGIRKLDVVENLARIHTLVVVIDGWTTYVFMIQSTETATDFYNRVSNRKADRKFQMPVQSSDKNMNLIAKKCKFDLNTALVIDKVRMRDDPFSLFPI